MAELPSLLRHNEWQVMLRNAHLICASPDSLERTTAARELIYRAMYKAALKQITDDERRQLLTILRPCCPDLFYTTMTSPDGPPQSE